MHDGDGNDGVKSGVAERQRERLGAESVETALGGNGREVEGTIAADFEERVGRLRRRTDND